MTASDTPALATSREWTGLAVIALPCAVYAMDLTVLNLALPAISADLRPSGSELLWIIDIYGFLVAGFLITMGTLGDRIGRRKLLLIGAAAFGIASAIAAFSSSSAMLIAMRALLGIAGATLAPSTLSLIRNMFHDSQQRQFAIGIWITSFSLGGAIGPLVGGAMLQFFWWGSVFLLAVPVMVLLLVVGPHLLPEYRDPHAGRIDLVSVAQSLAAVLATVYGLKQIAEHGAALSSVATLVGGLVIAVVFVRRQGRLPYPLLDTRLFRQPAFSAAIAAYALSCLAMFGVYIFVTQHLQGVLGLAPLQAGIAIIPWSLAFVVGSLSAPRMARRWSALGVIVGGLAVSALGFALLTFVDSRHALAVLVASTIVMSLGMAPVFTIGNEIIVTAAPPERTGAASAISETASEFSGALGVAVLGSVGIALYRHLLAPALPAGLSSEAAATALATLGGAASLADTLGGTTGPALLGAARSAFTDALQLVAAIGAVIVATASLLAARMLRRTGPEHSIGGPTHTDPTPPPRSRPPRSARTELTTADPIVRGERAAVRAEQEGPLERWMRAALEYVPRWLEFQMRLTEQPGCAVAIAHRGTVVLERAFGHADLPGRVALTPAHRFRVASHSKTFTAAAILKLREQGRLRLDDPIGAHVRDLHPRVAEVTLSQLLSHSAGLVRDGTDAGQWADRRAFLDEPELRADLADGPTIEANTRFKYSNHGFGLLGLAIEAVTGERYADWIAREIVAAAGLTQTLPDAPLPRGTPFARGHTGRLPLEHRLAIAGDNPTRVLAAATGFVSTAADLARFFGSLAPDAQRSVLSAASRREMTRRQWRDTHSSVERWYGLGTLSGRLGDWDWFGHSGGFQGTLTRTVCVPAHELAVSVLTNAADGPSQAWLDGVLHILQAHRRHGAPSRRAEAWQGRWWTLWGAFDLLPMDGKVLVANPALPNPVLDASEIEPLGRGRDGVERGRITLATGLGNHGEPARIERDRRGAPSGFWLAGMKLLPEAKAAKELTARYARR